MARREVPAELLGVPFVDAAAVARVPEEHRAPLVDCCAVCGGPVVIADNAAVYGRSFGRWPYVLLCLDDVCDARVGLHPGTVIPLGRMASADERLARKRAKDAFTQVVRSRFRGRRGPAYAWLASSMGLLPAECHFGLFGVSQCQEAERLCALALRSAGGGSMSRACTCGPGAPAGDHEESCPRFHLPYTDPCCGSCAWADWSLTVGADRSVGEAVRLVGGWPDAVMGRCQWWVPVPTAWEFALREREAISPEGGRQCPCWIDINTPAGVVAGSAWRRRETP